VNRGPNEGFFNPYLSADTGLNLYETEVCVRDSGFKSPNAQSSKKTCNTLTIEVLEANEPPSMPKSTITTLAENSPAGTVVGVPMLGTDPDDGDLLLYSIAGGDDLGFFSINPHSAVVQVADGAEIDFETRSSFNLQIAATDYCPGDCTVTRLKGNLSTSSGMLVVIKDVNEPPELVGTACSLDERVAVGTQCDHTTEKKIKELVTDQDANEEFTFSFRVTGYPVTAHGSYFILHWWQSRAAT
jgi:hypothetical protein